MLLFLAFPDYSAPFGLYTDASAVGIGAGLMQLEVRGKNRVIAYANKTFSHFAVTYRQTLSIV